MHIAVFPFVVVAIITAAPLFTAITTPLSTVATEGLKEVHVTLLSVASEGSTVAVSVDVSPTVIDNAVLFKETPDASILGATSLSIVVFSSSNEHTVHSLCLNPSFS